MSFDERKKWEKGRTPDVFNTNTIFEIRKQFIEEKRKELVELKKQVQLTELRGKVGGSTGPDGKPVEQGTGGLDAITAKTKPDAERQIKQQKQLDALQKAQGQTEEARKSA